MSGREKLTAVILTKNESHRIRACLDSIRWADEIIVVDGESTDDTAAICRSYGATVIGHRFSGSFADERNLGVAAATGDWILQLDADDRVTEGFRSAAREILKGGSPFSAYRFRRENFFLGHRMRFGGWYHYSLHFFRRGRARYEGRAHEELLVEGPVGRLETAIEHHPFSDFNQFMSRQNRYTSLEALGLLEKRGVLPEKEIRYQMGIKPLKLFFKMYVKKGGFREGMHGFLFSGLFAFVHFLKWAKYGELLESR
ncbi:MAG: glycosyltransferase family 2 protein [Candidatus Omnitrophica bacterium]|nr:glycosyltransferase family 2 protein [Candidatus Omnitrophota bacterium]